MMTLDTRIPLMSQGADPNAALQGFGQGFGVAKSLRDIARQDRMDTAAAATAAREASLAERGFGLKERELGIEEKKTSAAMDAQQQARMKDAIGYIGNVAQNAKSPQEWDAAVQSLAETGIIRPEIAQKYTGQFGQRGAVLAWTQNELAKFKDLPTSAQEYKLGQKDQAFRDYQLQMKQAGKPQVTIDQKTEGAFDKAVAEKDAKRFDEISQSAANANRMIGNIDQMQQLLATTPQGQIVDLARPLAQVASEMGIDVGDALGKSGAEAITAIIQRIAPSLRAPGSGSTSDVEFKGFLASLPKLSNTPGGNQLILDGLRAFANRSVEEAAIADEAMAGTITREEAKKRIRELGPVLPKQKAAQESTGGPKIGDVEQGYRFKGGNPADPAAWEKVQ